MPIFSEENRHVHTPLLDVSDACMNNNIIITKLIWYFISFESAVCLSGSGNYYDMKYA